MELLILKSEQCTAQKMLFTSVFTAIFSIQMHSKPLSGHTHLDEGCLLLLIASLSPWEIRNP